MRGRSWGFVFGLALGWNSVASWAGIQALPEMESVGTWCQLLSKELRSVHLARCQARQWDMLGKSTRDLPIPSRRWGAPDGRRVLILGGIHGDEISSVSLVFRWMDFLESTPEGSPLRKYSYLFIPLANPDGFWSSPRTRTNIAGVDLNRNFSTKKWGEEALAYWKSRTKRDPRRYPGPQAASEKETKHLQEWIEDFRPEMIVSVHAPYGILDHDGPVRFPKHLHSPLPVKTLGAFPGSLGRYAGIDRGIPVITVELMLAKALPTEKAISELFEFVLHSKAEQNQSVVR